MYENYADALESYIIPAEEGFKDSIKKIAIPAAIASVITVPIIKNALNNYKLNRIYRPFASAAAIEIILKDKKFKSIQYNSNIYELLEKGSEIIQESQKYFEALVKPVNEKNERVSYAVLTKIIEHFEDAIDYKLSDVPSGEVITADKNSVEVNSLKSAIVKYNRICSRMLEDKDNIYNNLISYEYVPSTHNEYGEQNYTKKMIRPSNSIDTILKDYENILYTFHQMIIDVQIKMK